MYDSRYPNMIPVDGRPLSGLSDSDQKHAQEVASAVCGKIDGLRCFYNVTTGMLLFVYGPEPFGGPLQIGIRGPRYDQSRISAMVEYIRLGRMPRVEKDRLAAQSEKAEKDEREKLGQKFRDDVRPDVLTYAAHLDQRRRGVAKKVVTL